MRPILVFFGCLISFTAFCKDTNFQGTWQGVLMRAGQSINQGTVVYLDLKLTDGILSGHMREETLNTEYFGVKQLTGKQEGNTLYFEQTVLENDKSAFRSKWCLYKGKLVYDSIRGYMTGSFSSTDCGRMSGTVILYNNHFELSKTEQSHSSQTWFKGFVRDFNDGLSAPIIRQKERENFVFEPIYFDFDQSVIREEHKAFLNRLIKVVKGHSDLRVLVVGHTDAQGSNGYNDVLSRHRAEAIIDYFVQQGISKERLKFDFKGENDPAAPNDTAEGRQRNRRVDFEFIQY